jgi:hypothetical protein
MSYPSIVRKNFTKNLFVYLFVLYLTSCHYDIPHKPGFVYIDEKTFKLDEKDFYPMILNYGAELMMGNHTMWVKPSNTGFDDKNMKYTKESALLKLKADLQMIKDLGFNTVRLYGIAEYKVDHNAITKFADAGRDTMIVLEGEILGKYFQALGDMFKVFDEVGLKAIILTKKEPDINELTDTYVSKLLHQFKDEKAILAWDFFNEPLYFDRAERRKEDVYTLVKGWKKFSRIYDPNHLLTLGLTGTREMFEWDPNILDVDFLSIHPYEFHKGEVENEIYWYSKYVKKPWVVGETGFSADNDSVSYDVQKAYALKFLHRAINCGASGFSWWQYKDVLWYEFQSNFLGLVNNKATTTTSNKDLIINGTVKPAGYVFKDFNPKQKTEECACRDNYYNYDGLNQYAVKGKLVNAKTEKPIEGGGVVAWDQGFGKSNITFSKEDGSFIIYGNYKLYHSMTSATEMSCCRQEFDWDKIQLTTENGIPTYDIGTIKLYPLKLEN